MRSPNTTLIKITDTQTPSSLAPPDRHNASEHCALLIDETMNAQPLRLVPQDVIDLVEFDPYPRILRFDFAWQVERQPTGLWSTLTGKNKPIDLDAACLMFDRMGGLLDTIWFGNLRAKDDSVRHSGDRVYPDDQHPTQQRDQETIEVYLADVADGVESLWFAVCAYHGHAVAQIRQLDCQISESRRDRSLATIQLHPDHNDDASGLVIARLYRDSVQRDHWSVQALAEPIDVRTPDELGKVIASWQVGR